MNATLARLIAEGAWRSAIAAERRDEPETEHQAQVQEYGLKLDLRHPSTALKGSITEHEKED